MNQTLIFATLWLGLPLIAALISAEIAVGILAQCLARF